MWLHPSNLFIDRVTQRLHTRHNDCIQDVILVIHTTAEIMFVATMEVTAPIIHLPCSSPSQPATSSDPMHQLLKIYWQVRILLPAVLGYYERRRLELRVGKILLQYVGQNGPVV
jgi:hypothetical protein